MSKVVILGSRLSNNPDTERVPNEQGVGGFVNQTVNGKLFYITDAMILKGLAPVVKSQMIWADDNGKFAISAEDYDLYNKGQVVEGKLQHFTAEDGLLPFEVADSKGDMKKYDYADLLVVEGQTSAAVLKAFNARTVQNQGSATPIAKPNTGTSGLGGKPVEAAKPVVEPAKTT